MCATEHFCEKWRLDREGKTRKWLINDEETTGTCLRLHRRLLAVFKAFNAISVALRNIMLLNGVKFQLICTS